MDLELLEHFVVLAETMNLSKASQQLFLTQPTLSRQMSSLEQDLGVALFIRDRRVLQLSPVGELLKKRAPELLQHSRQLKTELVQLEQRGKATLNIASLSLSDEVLTKYIKVYQKNNQYMEVEQFFEEPDQALKKLASHTYDIAFVTQMALESLPSHERDQLSFCVIETTSPVAIVAPNHHLAQRKSVALAELNNEALVTADDEVSYAHLKQYFDSVRFYPPELHRSSSLFALRYLINRRNAVGILLHTVAADVLDQYAAIEIEDFTMAENLCLVCRKDAGPWVRSFLELHN